MVSRAFRRRSQLLDEPEEEPGVPGLLTDFVKHADDAGIANSRGVCHLFGESGHQTLIFHPRWSQGCD
jgi:hypothetical protein